MKTANQPHGQKRCICPGLLISQQSNIQEHTGRCHQLTFLKAGETNGQLTTVRPTAATPVTEASTSATRLRGRVSSSGGDDVTPAAVCSSSIGPAARRATVVSPAAEGGTRSQRSPR